MSKPACNQFTADGCSVEWDRQGNVKRISYCPLHAAAEEMLEALRKADYVLGRRYVGFRKRSDVEPEAAQAVSQAIMRATIIYSQAEGKEK